MSSGSGALPFFSTLMPMSSSAAVNALVNPGSSGYRCRSRRTFGCLFGALPLSRSWCATWFAVVLPCCFGLHGSSQSLRIVDHAFLLLCVMSVDSIRFFHTVRRSSEMALISEFLPACDGAICEGIVFVFLSIFFDQFDGLGCQASGIVHSTTTRNVLSGDFS